MNSTEHIYRDLLQKNTHASLKDVADAVSQLKPQPRSQQPSLEVATIAVASASYQLETGETVPAWSTNYAVAWVSISGELLGLVTNHDEQTPEDYAHLEKVAVLKALTHLWLFNVLKIPQGLNDIQGGFAVAKAHGYNKHLGTWAGPKGGAIGASGCLPSQDYLPHIPGCETATLARADEIPHQGFFDTAFARQVFRALTTNLPTIQSKEPIEVQLLRAGQ